MQPHDESAYRDGDVGLRPVPGGTTATAVDEPARCYIVEWRGEVVGSAEIRTSANGDNGVGVITCAIHEPVRGRGIGRRAVTLLVDLAFHEFGLDRVEATIENQNRAALRVALRAGMRREGRLRGYSPTGEERRDLIVVGRLRDDPAPGTREGFTAMLDSVLPLKRAIAQGVVRNEQGEVLLCELAYKHEWDLPGGVVDPGESPATCVAREIREELGLTLQPSRLLAVDWLPPWLGWRDAVLFVFDLGTLPSAILERAVLAPREIKAVHWAGEPLWRRRVAPYTARLLQSLGSSVGRSVGSSASTVGAATANDGARYLEDGEPALPRLTAPDLA